MSLFVVAKWNQFGFIKQQRLERVFFRDRVYVKLADVKELASMRLKLNVYFYKSSTHKLWAITLGEI